MRDTAEIWARFTGWKLYMTILLLEKWHDRKHNQEVEKLKKDLHELYASHCRKIETIAKKNASEDEYHSLDEIREEDRMERQKKDINIKNCNTYYYIKKLKRLKIALPPKDDSDYWKSDPRNKNIYLLTDNGIEKLEEKIFLREKEIESFSIQRISVITGLIGAVIGLLSVLK